MPRPIREYGAFDWLRLRPLQHAFKQAGRSLLNRTYQMRAAPDSGALAAITEAARGGTLAVTVAFNVPWVVEWQLKFLHRHLDGATVVVADNSNDALARAELARIAAAAGVFYMPLPPNPYANGRNFSMSHGVALNWIYRQVVARAEPAVFAFLDHDLIPLEPVRLTDLVARQPFYGRIVTRHGERWYLWPGFSVFDYAAASRHPLDFCPDGPNGLDTGGMNYWAWFQQWDRRRLAFATFQRDEFDHIDGWIHFRRVSLYYRPANLEDRALALLAHEFARPRGTAGQSGP